MAETEFTLWRSNKNDFGRNKFPRVVGRQRFKPSWHAASSMDKHARVVGRVCLDFGGRVDRVCGVLAVPPRDQHVPQTNQDADGWATPGGAFAFGPNVAQAVGLLPAGQ